MSRPEDLAAQQAFYRERVVRQFNHTLEAQRAEAREDAKAAALLEEMQAVRASIVVQVDLGDALARHTYDIERGVMRHTDRPAWAPFLILGHSLADFAAIRRECGDSLLGFVGGLAGLGDEMRLTAQRVRSLRDLAGCLVFERVGAGGFTLFACFGQEPGAAAPGPDPRVTIRLDAALYDQLRAGEVDPQSAFLDGRVEIEGDQGMAIGLALAAVSPD